MKIGEVGRYEVGELVADVISPASLHLDTAIAYLTLVDQLGIKSDGGGPIHRLLLDQVEGPLVEVVDRESQALTEEGEIKTEVKLLRGLPCQLWIDCAAKLVERIVLLLCLRPVDGALIPEGLAERGTGVIHRDRAKVADATP